MTKWLVLVTTRGPPAQADMSLQEQQCGYCQKHCTLVLVEMMWVATGGLYCV